MQVSMIHIFDADDLDVSARHDALAGEPYYVLKVGDVTFFGDCARRAEMAAKLRAAATVIEECGADCRAPEGESETVAALEESRRNEVPL